MKPLLPLAVLLAVVEGLLDEIPTQRVAEAEKAVRAALAGRAAETIARIENGETLTDADHKTILEAASKAVHDMMEESPDGNASDA